MPTPNGRPFAANSYSKLEWRVIVVRNSSQGAIFIQLRTENCRLNQYLHSFKIIDDPNCDCGHGRTFAITLPYARGGA